MLANELRPLHLTIRASDEFGLPSEAKEAAAFALWHTRPGTIARRTSRPRQEPNGQRSWERSRMPNPRPVIPSEGGGALARRNESRDLVFVFDFLKTFKL